MSRVVAKKRLFIDFFHSRITLHTKIQITNRIYTLFTNFYN